MEDFYENIIFDGQKFAELNLNGVEFDTCTFENCNLQEVDLKNTLFIDCNISMAKLNKTAIRDSEFENCKMLGLRFENCNSFGLSFSFKECQLNFSSFFQVKMQHTQFKSCNLEEVDFSQADCNQVSFYDCNLTSAIFENTLLEKSDFRGAYNYSFSLDHNYVKGAKFNSDQIAGLLTPFGVIVEG